MTNTKAQTAGWTITRGGGNAGFNWHIGDGKTRVIAMVSTEERARLIAAAPELLAFARLIANFTPPGIDPQDDAEAMASLIRSARILVARAEARHG
jgi:hypothetical protein